MTAAPFLKWAGGKRQLLPELMSRVPAEFGTYFEPFLGGGALFFSIAPRLSVINDINSELIRCYSVVRSEAGALLDALASHVNTEEHFYAVRAVDPDSLSDVEAAARFIYLNRTCYNGLYRVNRAGRFNTPYGKYKRPNLVPRDLIEAASVVLSNATLLTGGYRESLVAARSGDFVYLDPPYFPVSEFSDFRRYSDAPFDDDNHRELAQVFEELSMRGCKVMLSNSAVPAVFDLYSDFRIARVRARRNISSAGQGRGFIDEVVVTNF